MRARVYILGVLLSMIPPVVGGFGVALLWERTLQRNADLAYQEAMTGTTDEHLAWEYRWLRRTLDRATKDWYGAWPAGAAWRSAMGITRRPAPPPLVLGGAIWRGAVGATWAPSSLAGTSFWVRADSLLRAGEMSLAPALLVALVLGGAIVERAAMLLARRAGRCFVPMSVGGRPTARQYLAARLRGSLFAIVGVGLVSAVGPLLIGTAYLHQLVTGFAWLAFLSALTLACATIGGAWRYFPATGGSGRPGQLWTCTRCRYQISATPPSRCPECGLADGDRLLPRVRLTIPASLRPYVAIFALSAVVVVVHWAVVTPAARTVTLVMLPHGRPSELVWSNGVRARIDPPDGAAGVWRCVWEVDDRAYAAQDAEQVPAVFVGPCGCEVQYYASSFRLDAATVYGRLVGIGGGREDGEGAVE